MRTTYTTAVIAALLLTGCYSFNHITLPDHGAGYRIVPEMVKGLVVEEKEEPSIVPNLKGEKQEVKTEQKRDIHDIGCQPYLMPQLPKTPELPIKEIMKVGPYNQEALDKIQTQHITDLRAYIVKIKQDLRTSHNEYLANCYTAAGIKTSSSETETK